MNRILTALAVATSLLAVNALAVTVTRPINIQQVTSTGAYIVWNTAEAVDAVVEYGPNYHYGTVIEERIPRTEHVVQLMRLQPGTDYCYKVIAGGVLLGGGYRFRTIPDARTTHFRFLVFGDSGKGDAAQYSLVPYMMRAKPDFMLHTGDVIYPAGEAEDFDPEYFIPYAPLLPNTPVWLTIGNHDDMTNNAQPYLDAFFLPMNPSGNERYYSFDYGAAHFVCLDSTDPFDATMLAWLRQDLAASSAAEWKFVFDHHPPYSCGMHGSSTSIRNAWAPIFEANGVDMVFSGHDHDYQRSYPMLNGAVQNQADSPDFVNPQGIIYIVTGGGTVPRETSSACSFTAAAVSATHFTNVEIWGHTLMLSAIDNSGQVIDTMSLVKAPLTDAVGSMARVRLLPASPNPFNPTTELSYELASPAIARLAVYDIAGRELRVLASGRQTAGMHRVLWDGRDAAGAAAASGVYVIRLLADDRTVATKVVLAK